MKGNFVRKKVGSFIVISLICGLLCGCGQASAYWEKAKNLLDTYLQNVYVSSDKEKDQDGNLSNEEVNQGEDSQGEGDQGKHPVENPPEAERIPQKDVNFLEVPDYTVEDPNNERGLSTERIPYGFGAAADGKPHRISVENQQRFDSYGTNGLSVDLKTQDKKVIYLTFDCGYKLDDLTDRLLDTLKEKDVQAAFFCTMQFLKEDPEGVQRMLEEGHIVGNHTATHPDCTTITRTEFAEQLQRVDEYMREHYNVSTKYFRFPTGAYSQDALDLAYGQGYRSIFWSFAYADWDPAKQPEVESSLETVKKRLHSGAVILLHSTSTTNVAILGDVIDYARSQGYEFRTLDEYEWNP